MAESTHSPDLDQGARAVAKRSFCILATTSPNGRPHVVRITPLRRPTTYGLGMSLLKLIRDPLHAGGSVDLPMEAAGSPR